MSVVEVRRADSAGEDGSEYNNPVRDTANEDRFIVPPEKGAPHL